MTTPTSARAGRLPAGVIALGFVSMMMDASSELIHSLLPAFLVGVLGASAMSVGVIEGIAEATASVGKVFSGAISDRFGKRKPLVLAGYGLAALTKPLFAMAQGVGAVFTARFIDRVGKGIRGAPRDALIADITPANQRGAAFGLRQSLDTVGAVIGPVAAVVLMWLTGNDLRLVLWFAVVPAVIAVVLIVVGVREPEHAVTPARRIPLRRTDIALLSRGFWLATAFAAVMTLARFSEAFLLLRAGNVGLSVRWIPLVLAVMNVAYAASSYPFGRLSDRVGKRGLLAVGLALLIAADIALAIGGSVAVVVVGAVLWGVHMGATQGILSALVADRAPAEMRGTAFGVFNLVSGLCLLLASVIAGGLWSTLGPAWTFAIGAVFAGLALAGLGGAHARRRVL